MTTPSGRRQMQNRKYLESYYTYDVTIQYKLRVWELVGQLNPINGDIFIVSKGTTQPSLVCSQVRIRQQRLCSIRRCCPQCNSLLPHSKETVRPLIYDLALSPKPPRQADIPRLSILSVWCNVNNGIGSINVITIQMRCL